MLGSAIGQIIEMVLHVCSRCPVSRPPPTVMGYPPRFRVKPHGEVPLLLLGLLLHSRFAAAGCCWLRLRVPGLLLLTGVATDAATGCLMKTNEN